MAIPNPNIDPNYVDKAWDQYQSLLTDHATDIADLIDKFEFYNNKSYASSWSDTKAIMIDSRPMYIDWCLNTSEIFIDLSPETFGTVLFWKEYWTLVLVVMACIFGEKMAERLDKKSELGWNFQFRIFDSQCDLIHVVIKMLNPKTGVIATPYVKLGFPTFERFKKYSYNDLEAGNFLAGYCPDIAQAPNLSILLPYLGKELKREYLDRCSINIK